MASRHSTDYQPREQHAQVMGSLGFVDEVPLSKVRFWIVNSWYLALIFIQNDDTTRTNDTNKM